MDSYRLSLSPPPPFAGNFGGFGAGAAAATAHEIEIGVAPADFGPAAAAAALAATAATAATDRLQYTMGGFMRPLHGLINQLQPPKRLPRFHLKW